MLHMYYANIIQAWRKAGESNPTALAARLTVYKAVSSLNGLRFPSLSVGSGRGLTGDHIPAGNVPNELGA